MSRIRNTAQFNNTKEPAHSYAGTRVPHQSNVCNVSAHGESSPYKFFLFFINMLNKRFDIQLTVSWTTSIFFCLTSLDSKDSKSFCRIQIRHFFLDSGQGCVDTHSFFADPDPDLNLAGCLNIKMNRWSPNPNRNVSDPPEWLFLSLQTSSIPDSSCKNHRFQIEFGREPYKKPL